MRILWRILMISSCRIRILQTGNSVRKIIQLTEFPVTVIVCVFILSIMSVSALSTTLGQRYMSEETMIGRIEGVLVTPIKPEQIELLRGHVIVPFEHDVEQLDSTTYLWGRAPRSEGNYTLRIKNIQAMQEGIVQVINYTHDFYVDGIIVPYAVRPGFIGVQDDFSVLIESYKDTEQTISVSHPSPQDIVLTPGQTKYTFSVTPLLMNTIIAIEIGKYKIPVFVRGNSSRVQEMQSVWIVEPPRVSAQMSAGKPHPSFVITAKYRGENNLKNVAVQYNKSIIEVNPDSFKSIKTNDSISFNVSIKQRVNETRTEKISFGVGNETYILSFLIEAVPLPEINISNVSRNASFPYCSQLSGIVCRENDKCSVDTVASKDGACCLGTCEQTKEKSKAWIGYLLVGIIILIGAIAWIKYKKVKTKDPLQTVLHQKKHP